MRSRDRSAARSRSWALCLASMAACFLLSCASTERERAETPVSAAAARPRNGALPNTPAGDAMQRWLDDFNGDDRAKIAAAFAKWEPEGSPAMAQGFREGTGGFDVAQVRAGGPHQLEFILAERAGPNTVAGYVRVDGKPPFAIDTLILSAVPKGTSLSDFTLDAISRARVVDGVIANVDSAYVFPDVAHKMSAALRQSLEHGDYNEITSGVIFANILTRQLQALCHDHHVSINYSPEVLPEFHRNTSPSEAEREASRRDLESKRCGFAREEILAGNIGYLKIDQFAPPDICAPTAIAAMNVVANTNALVIDLRDNTGGDFAMAMLLASYLFSEPTHLADWWDRETNETKAFWTSRDVEGMRFGNEKPVYVLTSNKTFSCAEAFAYGLQMAKRATIIGERTGGGAHAGRLRRIDDHFSVGVPSVRTINPISKTNWEGVGVMPDVKVAVADALGAALKLAAAR